MELILLQTILSIETTISILELLTIKNNITKNYFRLELHLLFEINYRCNYNYYL